MEVSMSQIAELAGLGIPVFIGCSVIVGNGDNLQNCFAKRDKLAQEEPIEIVGKQKEFVLPEELNKPDILEALNKLQGNNLLDEHYQPIGISITKRGILASLMADKFGIENPWIVFGKLWNMNKETLRGGCNKAVLQPNSDDTRKSYKKIIG